MVSKLVKTDMLPEIFIKPKASFETHFFDLFPTVINDLVILLTSKPRMTLSRVPFG